VTTAGYATALYWPWLNQIYEAYCVRCGKAASVGGLVFFSTLAKLRLLLRLIQQ
jgi:hypothetical protein